MGGGVETVSTGGSPVCYCEVCLMFFVCLGRRQLTCELDAGLAAHQHAVAVLRCALVLSGVRLVALSSLGEISDEQRAIDEHCCSGASRYGNPVASPGDSDRPLPLHLTVQHQGTVPDRNDITRLLQEGQLQCSEHT